MKRKILVTSLVVCLCLGAFAGGKKETPAAPAGSPKATVFKLAHGQTLESAAHKSLIKFSEELKGTSKGTIDVQLFPANQLGNERDLAEGLTMGTLDMAWISAGVMENFEPKFAIFSLPYIFRDYKHVHQVTDGESGKVIFDSLLKAKSVRGLAFYDQGFRFIWNNLRPINKIEDLKGMKVRSPESPVYMGTLKLLGTNPSPMPVGRSLYLSSD